MEIRRDIIDALKEWKEESAYQSIIRHADFLFIVNKLVLHNVHR